MTADITVRMRDRRKRKEVDSNRLRWSARMQHPYTSSDRVTRSYSLPSILCPPFSALHSLPTTTAVHHYAPASPLPTHPSCISSRPDLSDPRHQRPCKKTPSARLGQIRRRAWLRRPRRPPRVRPRRSTSPRGRAGSHRILGAGPRKQSRCLQTLRRAREFRTTRRSV